MRTPYHTYSDETPTEPELTDYDWVGNLTDADERAPDRADKKLIAVEPMTTNDEIAIIESLGYEIVGFRGTISRADVVLYLRSPLAHTDSDENGADRPDIEGQRVFKGNYTEPDDQ